MHAISDSLAGRVAVLLKCKYQECRDRHGLRGIRRLSELCGDASIPGHVARTTAHPVEIEVGVSAVSGRTTWTLTANGWRMDGRACSRFLSPPRCGPG